MAPTGFNSLLERTQRLAGIVGQEHATCDRHGAYEAQVFRDDRRSGCPACAEEAREKCEAEEWAAQRRQGAVAKLERRLGSAMIPPRFTGKTFESYRAETAEQKKALVSCRRYAEQFTENAQGGRCMLLLGKTGTGKTHLAAAVAQHVIREHGATAIYTTVSRICQHIRGSFGSDASYTEAQAIELFAQADLLVIDEVGASRDNDFERMSIFEVVNKRYEEMKPTVLVSNLCATKFEASVGDRTADRLREGGGFVLLFEWDSARRGAA